jgi:hypothetical protein
VIVVTTILSMLINVTTIIISVGVPEATWRGDTPRGLSAAVGSGR